MGLIVFRQMGTLHALLPLVSRMRDLKGEPLHLLGWDHLIPKDAAASLGITLFKNFEQFSELVPSRPAFLLTGTSEKSVEDEKLWSWARQNGVPSFAFVDQWSNIAIRFKDIQIAPDHIFVLDDWCANEVKKLKLSSRIHIVGTPLWDELSNISRKKNGNGCEAVFITEPVSVMPLEEHIRIYGYQDLDSLNWALKALASWQKSSGAACTLKIKLHPRDSAERVNAWLRKQNHQWNVQITNDSKQVTLETADFVFGDRSMFLVEASLVGVPVVSFQPHRKISSPATDRRGIEVVTTENELDGAMAKAKENVAWLPSVKSSDKILGIIKRELS